MIDNLLPEFKADLYRPTRNLQFLKVIKLGKL